MLRAAAFLTSHSSVQLTHLFSQLGGDVIQDQPVMGEHQKLFPPSLQHVSDVLPEEARTQSQLRSGAVTADRHKKKLDRLLFLSPQF